MICRVMSSAEVSTAISQELCCRSCIYGYHCDVNQTLATSRLQCHYALQFELFAMPHTETPLPELAVTARGCNERPSFLKSSPHWASASNFVVMFANIALRRPVNPSLSSHNPTFCFLRRQLPSVTSHNLCTLSDTSAECMYFKQGHTFLSSRIPPVTRCSTCCATAHSQLRSAKCKASTL